METNYLDRIYTIGIIDNSDEDRLALSKAIVESDFAKISFQAKEGVNAIERIKEGTPDILVIDELLPYRSGSDVISEISKLSNKPFIIVTLPRYDKIMVDRVMNLGADDIVVKPYKSLDMITRIESTIRIAADIHKYMIDDIEEAVSEDAVEFNGITSVERNAMMRGNIFSAIDTILLRSKFNPRLSGYGLIISAVIYIYKNFDRQVSVMKELYPTIELECSVPSSVVESAIRTSINSAWRKYCNSDDNEESVFKSFEKKPGNKEFLYRIAYLVYNKSTKDFKTI